ncbi:hypothetical protein MRB53_018767 [Persea americana]|uniref:Uncharacterized protein n=1 Tax=Persea americana TaxID=3435 RepID=A0ACC2M9G2_PERAE|nr:hypothetical protein MRB53_018767 [Persea americana]|eukprot:TRINITY_DN37738_c0_g1_i1.p1 TRINITY_DN37738_c0_g1~~TRINITY_DN37738_c0_g1_i1.p1  ORF type:complete len:597 (-),score=200.56 TRINITY_DN37738_c0_g1_i1:324-2114(-)
MTVEDRSEETQMAEVAVSEQEGPSKVIDGKVDEEMKKEDEPLKGEENDKGKAIVEKSSSFKEESNLLSDLKENERKALLELKAKVEEAILENKLFKKEEEKVEKKEEEKGAEEAAQVKEKKPEEEGEKEKPDSETTQEGDQKSKMDAGEEEKPTQESKEKESGDPGEEKKPTQEGEKEDISEEKENLSHEGEDKDKADAREEKKPNQEGEKEEKPEEKDNLLHEGEEKEKLDAEKEKSDDGIKEKAVEIDRDISIWGVPLLPSKGSESTDIILLKFLRAREFKVNEAFEMLRNTLRWREEFRMDSILDEDLGFDLSSIAYVNGVDLKGHPVCYNIYGVFEDDNLYQKTFATEEKRERFLRWRLQVMEKCIQQKLNFKPGGISSMLQINDLKNSPGPSKKELRMSTKQAVALLQDNYPEFVAKNIFINVPFWYYAFYALLSPFLTQRTKSKFVFARPAKVTETLLKYIAVDDIPICYGGFKRENDTDFSAEDGGASEINIKSGSTETVEIPAPEVGSTLLWDLTVLGWDVNYKEEFVPTDEGSYTIIVQKGKKMGPNEAPIRNSFRNNEPGKVVLTIENNTFKKKRAVYRYKIKSSS